MPLYLDDIALGQRFNGTTRIRIEDDRIRTFAAEFDPQPFHLDEAAAAASIFRGLAASGWHTAAVRPTCSRRRMPWASASSPGRRWEAAC